MFPTSQTIYTTMKAANLPSTMNSGNNTNCSIETRMFPDSPHTPAFEHVFAIWSGLKSQPNSTRKLGEQGDINTSRSKRADSSDLPPQLALWRMQRQELVDKFASNDKSIPVKPPVPPRTSPGPIGSPVIRPPPGFSPVSTQTEQSSSFYQMFPDEDTDVKFTSAMPPTLNELTNLLAMKQESRKFPQHIQEQPYKQPVPHQQRVYDVSPSPWFTGYSTKESECSGGRQDSASRVDEFMSCDSDSDDEKNQSSSHPNKYPVEIEYHRGKNCNYKRQLTRSGEKVKQKPINLYDPVTQQTVRQFHQQKYYQKHLARICQCGNYETLDGALQHGRSNDCNGYEIHYNQKCRWKAYDDFTTGNRVLIRLCKCYKPGQQ